MRARVALELVALGAEVLELELVDVDDAGVDRRSPVDLPEHDVLRADDRDHVGDHVAARHLVQRGEVHEVRARGS